ncbi:hypothetical protein BgiBS90_028520 [Biomphalaria glabrata]|nr:hypothetical protein BgiBS90_028520 [Biomphalaria glabrata]
MCSIATILDIGIDECQTIQAKSEMATGGHLQIELEETYLLDVRLLAEDDSGALEFVCNVAACEPAVSLRGVSREGLLKQRVRATAALRKQFSTLSLCASNDHVIVSRTA